MITDINSISEKAIDLLKQLIETPSLSSEEDKTADIIEGFLNDHDVQYQRDHNNIWAINMGNHGEQTMESVRTTGFFLGTGH